MEVNTEAFLTIGFVCCSYKMQNASTTRYL